MKLLGNDGPDLRLKPPVRTEAASRRAIVRRRWCARPGARFRVRVTGGEGRELLVVKDGVTIATVPVTGDPTSRYRFAGSG